MCAGDVCACCVLCVAPPPVTSKRKISHSLDQAPSCHLTENAQGLQTICAACPLLISSSFQRYPVCPRLHVQKRTCVRPSSLQAEVIVADHVDPRPLKMTPPPRTWTLQLPNVPQAVAMPALMFQCWNTYIMLRTWHRTDAAAWAPSRGLDAAAALTARAVFAPKALMRAWKSA